jgi:endonuclease/exonuclease/phosphatase family metal-dependent hydrolase
MPVFWIANATMAFLWLKSKNHKIWVFMPIVVLIITFPILSKTFAPNFIQLDTEDFSVMSYNVRVFNLYANRNKQDSLSRELIEWVAERDYDVKCIQEYYGKPGSKNYDSEKILKEAGYYSFVKPGLVDKSGAIFGMAIFSRYPIVKRGIVEMESDHVANEAIFADVRHKRGDTLRIINVHLESLSLREEELTKRSEVKSLLAKLQDGWTTRAGQAEILARFIQESPYQVILVGDLNDTPYSYTYRTFRNIMDNAFEEAGFGFGFSYNGIIPILRIDGQFYDRRLKAVDFHTIYTKNDTDHFPIVGYYKFR